MHQGETMHGFVLFQIAGVVGQHNVGGGKRGYQ